MRLLEGLSCGRMILRPMVRVVRENLDKSDEELTKIICDNIVLNTYRNDTSTRIWVDNDGIINIDVTPP